MGNFSYMPSAGFGDFRWLLYVGNFFLTKFFAVVKVNKNVHNWVMLFFKAEADIQYRLHKVAADNAEINTNMKWVPVKRQLCS